MCAGSGLALGMSKFPRPPLFPVISAVLFAVSPWISAESPNILFLFTDDQRFDTIRALGNADIETPNIDRLVREGTAFTNAYIMGGTSPAVCSPSRAMLFSGRTIWNTPCQGEYGFELPPEFVTLPEAFRGKGYATFATGKNEPGQKGHFARSFAYGENILFKGMTRTQYEMPLFDHQPDGDYLQRKAVVKKGVHSAELYAESCVDFLESRAHAGGPFFAYVAFQTPHDPRESPPEFRERYKDAEMPLPANFLPEHPFNNGMLRIRDENLAPFPRTEEIVRKEIADYYACITHTDAQIGRILDALEITGQRGNTVIVFASDNGLAIGSHGLMGKQNVYEHSVRVPLIIAGPGIPKGETRSQLCYLYDIHPTLCEMAGVPVPETVQFRNLMPVLKDPHAIHREHLYFAFMSWQRAVTDGHHKLIEYCVGGKRTTQLFDLSEDPEETRNLSNVIEKEPVLSRLRKLLEEERVRLNDGNSASPFSDKQGKDFWSVYETPGI